MLIRCYALKGGFTLIEVLIAILILALGLLGMSSMMMHSMSFNHSASLRSQAIIQAYDVVDRMRANRPAAQNGNYNRVLGDAAPGGASRAEQDLAAWLANLGVLLPNGDGAITVANNVFTVTIQWSDDSAADRASENNTSKQISVRSML